VIRHVTRRSGEPRQKPPLPVGRPTVEAAYTYCEQLTRAHHENFPVASVFLPSRLRPHVLALYAFVRMADDFADEPEFEGRREAELDRWDDLLARAYHGEAEHPVFVALADTAEKFDLPITPMQDVLQAFHMDLRVRRYPSWKSLKDYMQLAAAPIGRVLLYIFGVRDEQTHRYAEELSYALALTNFWQDIAVDVGRDRIYLPLEDLHHFGVREADVLARKESPELAACVRHACARARAQFERARPLIEAVPDQIGVEVAMFFHGGARALAKVEAHADHVFGERVSLGTVDKARVLAQALRTRGAGLTSRLKRR
jgi:squalene synthase HpnC